MQRLEVNYNGNIFPIEDVPNEATDADILAALVEAGFHDLDGGTITRDENGTIIPKPAASKSGK